MYKVLMVLLVLLLTINCFGQVDQFVRQYQVRHLYAADTTRAIEINILIMPPKHHFLDNGTTQSEMNWKMITSMYVKVKEVWLLSEVGETYGQWNYFDRNKMQLIGDSTVVNNRTTWRRPRGENSLSGNFFMFKTGEVFEFCVLDIKSREFVTLYIFKE